MILNLLFQIQKHNIKYYYQENKEKVLLKFGFKKAKGQYINFFDSDDIAYLTIFKLLMKL